MLLASTHHHFSVAEMNTTFSVRLYDGKQIRSEACLLLCAEDEVAFSNAGWRAVESRV